MIKCNEIKQEADELKMKMSDCTKIKTKDIRRLLDLINALNECKCNCSSEQLPDGIFSFQFNNLTDNISNIDKLTDVYLNDNGLEHNESSLITGKNVTYSTVGRVGFVINNSNTNPYRIFDILNNDITDTMFDTSYNNVTKTFYYVSKEYYVPSSLYFKFIKQ